MAIKIVVIHNKNIGIKAPANDEFAVPIDIPISNR